MTGEGQPMKKSKVAILRTTPATVLEDYHRLMNLADYQSILPKSHDTALKMNISWHLFYPGSSTTPWQIDGVIRAMKRDGYDPNRIHACHNRTVVIDAHLGERENKQVQVTDHHRLRNIHLYEDEEWIHVRDAVGDVADKFIVLNQVYRKGFMIPKRLIGENILHLPTIKAHIFTTTTGAMKNAFGGLLNERRHWTHPVIHETLVDLLRIQLKIHPGVFAVMDGTFAGDGPGPRCMVPYIKNVILASSDQVAIDAVSAKLMGFDPLSDLKYVRLAHEAGLGCGNVGEIQIVGDEDVIQENWGFVGPFKKMTFASRMQHKIYWGRLKKPLEWTLKTILAPWSYIASVVYHDFFWYPTHQKRIKKILGSDWGRLFYNWENVVLPAHDLESKGFDDVGSEPARLQRGSLKLMLKAFKILGTTLKEAPEFTTRKRHKEYAGLKK